MKDNKVDRIWFFEQPKGKIHPPLSLDISETLLPNFKWDIDYRPLNKDEVFIWKKGSNSIKPGESEVEGDPNADTEDMPEN